MENVWDATKLMLIVYGLAAVVSFLVAGVITLTFAAIRMHAGRGAEPLASQGKATSASAKPEPGKGV